MEHYAMALHQLDFSTGKGIDGLEFVLVICEDLLSFVLLWHKEASNPEAAELKFTQWISSFMPMKWFFNIQGSHFVNALHKKLAESFHILRNFTLACTPDPIRL